MTDWRFVEEFAADQEYHRILPVGTFKRFGRRVEITPDKVRGMVDNFNQAIPDTGVPINAEHARTEGRLGQVTGLVERADGAYAALQFTDAGQKLIAEERFRYVSPEIVWGPTDWEQHDNVSNILVGLALTNSPFFGQDVSLFSLNDQEPNTHTFTTAFPQMLLVGGDNTRSEKVSITNLKDGDTDDPPIIPNKEEPMEDEAKIPEWFTQLFKGKDNPPAPEQHNGPTPEEFEALQKQNQELADKLSEQKRKEEHAARVAEYSALVPEGAPASLIEDLALFAAVDPEAAQRVAKEYATTRGQVEEAGLFKELGSGQADDEHTTPVEQFNALVQQKVSEGLDVVSAMNAVAKERPELKQELRKGGK
jgi:hypothetical protein